MSEAWNALGVLIRFLFRWAIYPLIAIRNAWGDDVGDTFQGISMTGAILGIVLLIGAGLLFYFGYWGFGIGMIVIYLIVGLGLHGELSNWQAGFF